MGASGPPISSASDSGVSMFAVNGCTSTPCMPGAVTQPGSWLPNENKVSRDQIPGTVVSLYPAGGCSRGSEYAICLGSVNALVNWFTPKGGKLNLIASRIGARYCAHISADSW